MNELRTPLATFDAPTRANIESWLEKGYDEETKEKIRQLLLSSPGQLIDSFYKKLEFGTGGIRGIVDIGTNRINRYTIRAATQALANYLLAERGLPISVVIGYDSRLSSKELSYECAKVLAGNRIHVRLFGELRPTPLVSFTLRAYGSEAAIMITASHNPKEYNGYKVYWSDGGQLLPPHDEAVIKAFDQIKRPEDVSLTSNPSLIDTLGDEDDERYLQAMEALFLPLKSPTNSSTNLQIVYTPLHGTGITLVPQLLKRCGFSSPLLVQEQSIPDGNFPTAPSPNPELPAALALGKRHLQESGGDLLLANDPDADRIACVIRQREELYSFSGNEIAAILAHYLADLYQKGKIQLPKKAGAIVKSIVTTPLLDAIAKDFSLCCFNTLTGFKYIAALIHRWEQKGEEISFLFGAEESLGYLYRDQVRDKDGIFMTVLIANVALMCKERGETLLDYLHSLYQKYGVYRETVYSHRFEGGKEGIERIQTIMNQLRLAPPKMVQKKPLLFLEDYSKGTSTNADGTISPIDFPTSNVLRLALEGESFITIRPSGTEPLLKIYVQCKEVASSSIAETIQRVDLQCQAALEEIKQKLAI